jgi:hypothetical protein
MRLKERVLVSNTPKIPGNNMNSWSESNIKIIFNRGAVIEEMKVTNDSLQFSSLASTCLLSSQNANYKVNKNKKEKTKQVSIKKKQFYHLNKNNNSMFHKS